MTINRENRMLVRLQNKFSLIKDKCAIVTACDSKHAPFLINALASIKVKFPDHPKIVIYDTGLSFLDKWELSRIDFIEVRGIPRFVPHWNINWSWKLYVITNENAQYLLYLDLPNFVFMRNIRNWFLSIEKNSYFLVSNGQNLGDITPSDYWRKFGLDISSFQQKETFGAGIIGIDKNSTVYNAISEAMTAVMNGLNLGRSINERNSNYKPNIIRDCVCFRADQTVLNLSFYSYFSHELEIRKPENYVGQYNIVIRKSQYLWYARRTQKSLIYSQVLISNSKFAHVVNRLRWNIYFGMRDLAKSILSKNKSKHRNYGN